MKAILNMTIKSKIAPCPFCGNKKHLRVVALEYAGNDYFIAVHCSRPVGCNSYGPSALRTDLGYAGKIWKKTGVDKAIRLWNRRYLKG
jgi:hypothetical protein